jgi:hypothetical protein
LTGVNYEGPYDWHYGVTDAEIGQDFQLFKANDVDRIIINIIWSSIQRNVNPALYNTQNIANIKRVLAKAEQYGISVCVSFFQYWMNTSTGVPSWCIDPWTGLRRYIAIVRDRAIRGYFLEMIGDLVDELKASPAIECWSLLNEPMHSGSYNSSQLSTEREEFHLLIEEGCSVIQARDNRPITVKFTLPYSPWHTGTRGAYPTFVDFNRVMQSLDFMSINTFANPADYGTTRRWQGTTWSEFVQAIQDTKNAGYIFWVGEFGSNKGDEAQRQHYQSVIQIFRDLGVDACYSWAWVHDDGAEAYNVCYSGGLPKPAFYELNITGVPTAPDISVADVTPSRIAVGEGVLCALRLNVTVANQFEYAEFFNVTAYADMNVTAIGDEVVIGRLNGTLPGGNSTTIIFTWNTTEAAKGNYTISVIAAQVAGETETADNSSMCSVSVTTPGDVNGDGVIDAIDMLRIGKAYGSTPGTPDWNANCDIDNDGDADSTDLSTFTANYGETWLPTP